MPAVTPAVRAFSTFSLSDSSFTLLLTVSKLRVNWWVSWVGAVAGTRSLLLASARQAGPSRDSGTFLQYRQPQPPCWTLFLNPLCP